MMSEHLENFYISLEKKEKLRYLSYGMTDLREIWHVDKERVSVHGC